MHQNDSAPAKKPYQAPSLIEHGTLAELTQLSGGALDVIANIASGISDRNLKEGVATIDPKDILDRLVSVPVQSWNYKFQDASVRHIGPMAQDFAEAFGVGESDKRINMIDANGVAMAAIQGLFGLLQEQKEQLESLRSEVAELKAQRTQGHN